MSLGSTYEYFSYVGEIKTPYGKYHSLVVAIHDARDLAIQNNLVEVVIRDKNSNKVWDSRIDQ